MDPEVIQIIELKEGSNLVLNTDGLKQWLEPIKDKEVAIIPGVGSSQTGRSLLLNLLGHHLSGSQLDQLVKGFESKASLEPITTGFWLSKPILFRKDDGKELAVLLMDTQSVFDGNLSTDDSNRIFWISLLLSSSLIINLGSNLSEDFLTKLRPFLEYIKPDSGCADSLIFMIRDWTKTNLFRHGRDGGQQFLNNRLEIRNNSSEAITTKRLLKNCFKELSCHLMPGLGLEDEVQDFSGDVTQLGQPFTQCFKELMSETLNANKLKPKMIRNKCLKGSELIPFFEVYVSLLSRPELPTHIEISAATTKTLDIIIINEYKERHSKLLDKFIKSKESFVTRNELNDHYRRLSDKIKKTFNEKKGSSYPDIVEQLNQLLDTHFQENYEKYWAQNESNRHLYMLNVAKECAHLFENNLLRDYFCDNQFLRDDKLEQVFEIHRNRAVNGFKSTITDEEESLFDEELRELENRLNLSEDKLRTENHKRLIKAVERNSSSIIEVIDYYKVEMEKALNSNQFLSVDVFDDVEEGVKGKARKLFKQKCSCGDSSFIQSFDNQFRNIISNLKYDFREQTLRKRERVIVDYEIASIDLLDEFEESLAQFSSTCDSPRSFEGKCKELMPQCLAKFDKMCSLPEFRVKLQNKLISKIKSSVKDFLVKSFSHKK